MARPHHANAPHIVFWGHACVGVHADSDPALLIDPFDPRGLGGTPGPPAIPTDYPCVIATHSHADHAAFHTQPHADVICAPYTHDHSGIRITSRLVAHDEFGGRLRGGHTQLLDIRIGTTRILHMGDIGERMRDDAIDELRTPTPDLLIVPAGGYFTLGADAAASLAAAIAPHRVLFCHTQNDGLPLPNLSPRAVIERRVRHWPQAHTRRLSLSKPPDEGTSPAPTVVWMERPDGAPFRQPNGIPKQ